MTGWNQENLETREFKWKNLVVHSHTVQILNSHGANLKGGNENLVTCTTVDEQSGFSTKKTPLVKVLLHFCTFGKVFMADCSFKSTWGCSRGEDFLWRKQYIVIWERITFCLRRIVFIRGSKDCSYTRELIERLQAGGSFFSGISRIFEWDYILLTSKCSEMIERFWGRAGRDEENASVKFSFLWKEILPAVERNTTPM